MKTPTASESAKRSKDNERPLLEDIRLLGRILGDEIREQEGVEAVSYTHLTLPTSDLV